MKNKIKIFSLAFALLMLICCSTIRKTDSVVYNKKIEILLSKHKRYAFIDLYEKSVKNDEMKHQIKKCDSIFDLSSNELYNENCITMDFYSVENKSYENKNYDLLIKKWLNKDYFPYMPTDNSKIKTTMALKKALDFYESEDLKNYIDSLRNFFYKKHKEGKLECK